MDFRRLTCVRGFSASFFSLTTVGLIWFACRPAAAQLSVTAPHDGQVRQMQAWYEHHVPMRFRAQTPILVRELNDAQMAAYLKGDDNAGSTDGAVSHTDDDGGDIDGIFESDPDRIALRLSPTAGVDMFTFAHEYGHYVWFHLLTRDYQKRYEAIYKRQCACHHLVTRYAATDLEEGFAEAFSFYACEPLILARRDAPSFQFLKQCAEQTRS